MSEAVTLSLVSLHSENVDLSGECDQADEALLLPTEERGDDRELLDEESRQDRQRNSLIDRIKYVAIGLIIGSALSFSIDSRKRSSEEGSNAALDDTRNISLVGNTRNVSLSQRLGGNQSSSLLKRRSKVFNLGLPKSGSTSMQDFFTCVGRKSFHWQYNRTYIGDCVLDAVTNNVLIEKVRNVKCNYLRGFDVLAQMDYASAKKCHLPQIMDLNYLNRMYPDALYVLPLRPSADWAKSVSGWSDLKDRIINCVNQHNLYNLTYVKKNDKQKFLAKFYDAHKEYIQSYFLNRCLSFRLVA